MPSGTEQRDLVFLSDAWLEALDAAVHGAAPPPDAAALVIEQVVTGVPGRGDVRYQLHVDGSGARVQPGHAEAPTVRLTSDYVTAVAISRGEENAQTALAAGRLRVGGDVEILARYTETLTAFDHSTATLRFTTIYPPP
jgi:hypothetical protein